MSMEMLFVRAENDLVCCYGTSLSVETESVCCQGTLHDRESRWKLQKLSQFYVTECLTKGKHVGKCRNCSGFLSRNTSQRRSMLENVETAPVFWHGALHNGEACWKM
jgi:hypothetical protein